MTHPSSLQADRGEVEAEADTVRLEDLLAIIRRHLWLVLVVVTAAVAVSAYLAYRMGPDYRAVAVIRLSDPRRVLTGGVVEDRSASAEAASVDPLLSQVELLTSRAVASAVVDSMPMLRVQTRNLPPRLLKVVAVAAAAGADSFQITFGRDSFVAIGASGERRATYATAVDFGGIQFAVLHHAEAQDALVRVLGRDVAVSSLIAHLRVRPRARTDIVDVAYSAPDPRRAQQVVNRVVESFRTTSAEAAQRQSRLRREFLESQLRVNDSLLADARQALTAFDRRSRAYGARGPLAREQMGLQGLELQREQLDAERQTYQGLLTSLRDTSASRRALQVALSIPGVAASPAVAQVSAQLFQYETARDSLASRSASHPDLPRLKHLVATTEATLLRAVQAGLQGSIASLDGRIAAINDVRARQAGMSATEAEETRLTERVENVRKIVDELRNEYQRARIAEAVTVGQVEIVDHAILPAKPVGLGLAELLALGLVLGLGLGAGGALVVDRLGSSIARRVQVEHLGMTVLGVVPRCGRNGDRKAAHGDDAVIEAFRGVRLNLLNGYGAARPVVVTVSSPGSGDGKSFVSSNLALAFAYHQCRTLLVDADLRRGALHRPLNLRRLPGLTDLLAGTGSLEESLQPTTYPFLDFLSSGSRRRDAPELIDSARMSDLVTSLRSRYEVIVLDSAPLGAGVDAFTLARLAGNLLMVLRLGRTDRQMAEAKLDILRRLPLRLLGAVLNDAREGSDYQAYGYYLDGYELASEPLYQPIVASREAESPSVGR
jgi:succinoglycan biosynthesis transport protein ExoP